MASPAQAGGGVGERLLTVLQPGVEEIAGIEARWQAVAKANSVDVPIAPGVPLTDVYRDLRDLGSEAMGVLRAVRAEQPGNRGAFGPATVKSQSLLRSAQERFTQTKCAEWREAHAAELEGFIGQAVILRRPPFYDKLLPLVNIKAPKLAQYAAKGPGSLEEYLEINPGVVVAGTLSAVSPADSGTLELTEVTRSLVPQESSRLFATMRLFQVFDRIQEENESCLAPTIELNLANAAGEAVAS